MLIYAFDHPHVQPAAELHGLLGGKGAGLAEMTTTLGLPVPPGFTVTTEACRSYLRGGWPLVLDEALRGGISRLEAALGRGFGHPTDPLLVSVRSGAPVSMPGMLDTLLNVGLTRAAAAGLAARAGAAFAEECRARLVEMFQNAAGANAVPEDPWLQLRAAIEAVFRSWHGERARTYRERQGISDDLGTAVSVQAMVFGNLDERSATGVLFTRDPATGEAVPYGDVLFRAQGEEVVAGRRRTEPISALAARLPQAAEELFRAARALERHHRDLCDIEFTVERGRLWLLQARVGQRSPQAALRIALELAQDPDFPLERAEAVRRVAPLLRAPPRVATVRARGAAPAARGLGASPGFASGEVALDPDAAVAAAAQARPVILVRAETSPEDVRGIAAASGILTARGGLVSHAAVVARAWGIPAVVGVEALALADGAASLAGARLAAGEVLSLDG
jgi:pyruvate,orthophosphate dikinase